MRFLQSHTEFFLTLLRIGAGVLFWFHGAQKFGMFGGVGGRGGAAEPMSLLWLAGVFEFVLGPAIALGLFTRSVALLAAAEMAVAYVRSHVPRGPWPLTNGGELALLYAMIWLVFVARGPGRFSLDALFGIDRR
jgi:putative oxidoreductase